MRVRGCAQAHTHQHVTAAPALSELGAEISIAKAKTASGLAISDVRYAAVYDSFTITLAMRVHGTSTTVIGLVQAAIAARHQIGRRRPNHMGQERGSRVHAQREHLEFMANVDEVAAEHGVALGTMRRALDLLADQGLVERIHGRGTFVNRAAS